MCKFKDCDDPNYRKFGAEMKRLYGRAIVLGVRGEPQPLLRGARSQL